MMAQPQQPITSAFTPLVKRNNAPYLQVNKVWKHYGNFAALKDVSLEIKDGEFVCFLGPSGCGKTTLLRAIAGLDPQSRGEIVQGGQTISLLPPEQRDFGIVFQSYALFPNLTVAKNIAYGLRSLKLSRNQIEAKVTELLNTIGLSDMAYKYPAQLSGGQQQRIALARALATEPSLLLLDEPLSALDARVRLHLRQEIRKLQRKLGITTIMVTHDQEEALAMADRIVVMNHGIVEQVGTPEEVYRRPINAFVANFVGTMNLLPVKVSGNKQVRLQERLINCRRYKKQLTAAAWLAFRPEVAAIKPAGLHGDDKHYEYFNGTVLHTEFMGNFLRIEVNLSDFQQSVQVDVSSQHTDLTLCMAGHQVSLAVPVNELQVFDRYDNSAATGDAGHSAVATDEVAA